MDRGPPNKWKLFVGNRVTLIQEETASASWRHVPSQSNPSDLNLSVIEPKTLSTSKLWWKGPQWLSQDPSSWPKTEMNKSTNTLEVRNVHVAFIQLPEDITQGFSNLNRSIRVFGYCKRFISKCRNTKANRKSTILSTQDNEQALICCVKIVQQISYAQEMRNLMEQQEVETSSSLNTLLHFIDKEGPLTVGGRLQQSTLPYQIMHQMI